MSVKQLIYGYYSLVTFHRPAYIPLIGALIGREGADDRDSIRHRCQLVLPTNRWGHNPQTLMAAHEIPIRETTMDRSRTNKPIVWMDEDVAVQFHGFHKTPGQRAVRFDRYLAICLLTTIGATGTVLATSLATLLTA